MEKRNSLKVGGRGMSRCASHIAGIDRAIREGTMKKTIFSLGIFGLAAFMISGCATVSDQIFLQNAQVKGSANEIPIHVVKADTKTGEIQISARISTTNARSVSTTLEEQYTGSYPDTLEEFKQTGLHWNMPALNWGLGLDYALTDHLALMGGLSLSVVERQTKTTGYAGLGIFNSESPTAFRLDVGVYFSKTSYKAATILKRHVDPFFGGTPTDETYYFYDRGIESHINVFASMTLNSSNRESFTGWFLQVGIVPQELTEFKPRETITNAGTSIVSDQRAESSVFWLSGMPGLSFNVGSSQRILVGLRLMYDLSGGSMEPGMLMSPMVQFDMSF